MPTTSGRRRREGGQILAIVAGGTVALLLLVGLVIDGGIAFVNRRDAQNVSDVMALAATKYIADVHTAKTQRDPSISSTYAALQRAATDNGCAATNDTPCTWRAWFVRGAAGGPQRMSEVVTGSTVPSSALGVEVEVNRQPKTFISSLAQIDTWNVTTAATAVAEQPTSFPSGILLPIGMFRDPSGYEPGQEYDITNGTNGPGNFGWLTWSGAPQTPVLESSLCTPNNPQMTLPVTIEGAPGKHNSTGVRACLQNYVDNETQVLIPIFDTYNGGGGASGSYHVVAVAAFIITGYSQPAVDLIQGHFVGIYNVNPVPAGLGSAPPKPGDTSYFLGLVR